MGYFFAGDLGPKLHQEPTEIQRSLSILLVEVTIAQLNGSLNDHWDQGAGLVRDCSPVMYDFHGWSRPQLAAKVRLSWWKYISTDFYEKKTRKKSWNTSDKPLWTFAIGVNHGSRFHIVADALWTLEFQRILTIFFWPWTFSTLGNIQAVLDHHLLLFPP